MPILSEADVEAILLGQLQALGYACLIDTVTSNPDGPAPERDAYADVILSTRFRAAVDRLNPTIPSEAREDAIKRIIASERPTLLEENRRLHRLLVEGVPVEFRAADGGIRGDTVRLIDPTDAQNDWLAISQFTVIEGGINRRPDVVVFLNGLPVAVIEVKKPGAENATLGAAYQQLQTYKSQIGSLFRTNALLVTTDGILARVGSLTANAERFMPWRTTDGSAIAPKGSPEMSVLIEGLFERKRLLSLMRDFTMFGEMGAGTAKIIAGYHQFHAVHKAVASTVAASRAGGDRKVGVIWHTQGSGKSLLMAFYAGLLVRDPAMENPTVVVITDRNDLDDQLFATFSMCRDLIRQTPIQAESREDLQAALSRASGGVIFTTIQKFAPARGEAYQKGLTGSPHERLVALAEALNWVLAKQEENARKETTSEAQKRAHRRFQDHVLALSKAFALASASDAARAVRDEVGFFQTVRAAMAKASNADGQSSAAQEMAIRQIVDRAVVSTEIVDILHAAGITAPDISILSDEFLAEMQQLEKKNLALEALKKLLNDEIRSRARSNVTETRRFSERLEEAIARYHTNAVSTVEVLQELIALAKEIREARLRGEAEGLTAEEVAFYDALADNESAVKVMGNEQLKVIAHELLQGLRSSITIDWAHRDSARARLRVLVKRILRKYGYPPDLQDGAVKVVLQQAEALSARLAA